MPTGAENRRLNLEKHYPPRKRVGCMDCVAQGLHMEQASRRYFWTSLSVRLEELFDLCPALTLTASLVGSSL